MRKVLQYSQVESFSPSFRRTKLRPRMMKLGVHFRTRGKISTYLVQSQALSRTASLLLGQIEHSQNGPKGQDLEAAKPSVISVLLPIICWIGAGQGASSICMHFASDRHKFLGPGDGEHGRLTRLSITSASFSGRLW